ncbi:MAG: N-acetylmuramoyl-L-alanine amidase, partial [Actinobacteria bacterium]|nr:N-acetylmuramoyl-L-alanine amidase [Actinomycetota bacterium]
MRSGPGAAVLVWLALLAGCSSDRADTAEAAGTHLARRSVTSSGSTTSSPTTSSPTTTVTVPSGPDPRAKALQTATGVIVPVLGVTAEGYRVRTPCGREASVTGGKPLRQATVVLDPGHGGVETGSVGANGLVERDLNLEIAHRVVSLLEQAGVSVVLTRMHDYRITIATRAEIALGLAPRAFVSIHHNGGSDGPSMKPGTETFFQIASTESRRLAGLIQEELFATFATHRDIAWEADSDAGAKYRPNASGGDYYGILRRSAGV